MLTTVEKVIILQEVDVFESLTTEQLAHLASIAEELNFTADEIIFAQGGMPDSMYLLLEGKVRLHRGDVEVMVAGKKDAFGTWALFDDEPRVVTATTLEDSAVLRIDRDDFVDLLADNIAITQGIIKALVGRVRRLMGVASHPVSNPQGNGMDKS